MSELNTVRLGSQGPFVELLQLALYRAGFLNTAPDGIFGLKTQAAVLNFQKSYSLTQDGIVGRYTWAALNSWLTGYVHHTAKQGDTFYRLAKQYSTTIMAIEAANPNVDPFNIQIGSRLTIPRGFDVVATNISFTPTYLSICIEGLTARYPFLGSGVAGKSEMGKPINFK
jgi:g-D-glutamyl-meso-diaminopimelate peptidase